MSLQVLSSTGKILAGHHVATIFPQFRMAHPAASGRRLRALGPGDDPGLGLVARFGGDPDRAGGGAALVPAARGAAWPSVPQRAPEPCACLPAARAGLSLPPV